MKQSKRGATGPRGHKGARGSAGAIGRRGTTGKAGRRGIRGLSGKLHNAEFLDRLVVQFEDIYQQLTVHAKQIAALREDRK